jgi:predicted flap endonuclease-1-like 5' DNA nuclease
MAWNGTEGGKAAKLKAELDACHSKTKHLSEKVDSLQGELSKAKSASSSTSAMSAASPISEKQQPASNSANNNSFDAAAAKAVIGKKVVQDDLKIVEGIGPKIADLFIAAGIKTWKDLSETTIDKANEILKNAGERYAIHNPGTWPRQAKLMYEGKWEELKAWQDTLDGGKE